MFIRRAKNSEEADPTKTTVYIPTEDLNIGDVCIEDKEVVGMKLVNGKYETHTRPPTNKRNS